MKYFYIDMLGSMAESLERATNDKVMALKIRQLAEELSKHVEDEQRKQPGS